MAMGPEDLAAMVSDAMGMEVGVEDSQRVGDRVWNLERLFNNATGMTRADDSLPPRMLEEPLTEGASKGHVVPLQKLLDDYYQVRGWDSEGRPTREKLTQLGLA
jgi:aldehyde:ferredoxin oxidoreductase